LRANEILPCWPPFPDRRCHASEEEIAAALAGNWREEHLFALGQALELYDTCHTKVVECDLRIEAVLRRLRDAAAKPAGRLPPARHRGKTANAPIFDARAALHAVLGVDLTQICARASHSARRGGWHR